jgi:predicted ferric reductase
MLVKIYRPNENLEYPEGGKFTPHLEKCEVGARLMMEGPYGKFSYHPGGKVFISNLLHMQSISSTTATASS